MSSKRYGLELRGAPSIGGLGLRHAAREEFQHMGSTSMRLSTQRISRIFALSAAVTLLAGCGNGGGKVETSTPGANPGDNTIVSTVPDAPAPDTASLTPSTQVVTVAKHVWDDYQTYLTRVGRIGNGYYAVTEDGMGGASWSCGDALCGQSYNGKEAALKSCQDGNPGKTCLIFAKDNHPQVRYEIAP
jgi:hypothetical protein